MRLYANKEGAFVEKGQLLFGRNLMETFVMTEINNHILLMFGGYDSKIHVYST